MKLKTCISGIALVGLTACGGSTSEPMSSSGLESVPAPMVVQQPNAAPAEQQAATDAIVPDLGAAEPIPQTPDVVDTPADTTTTSISEPVAYVPDLMLLNGASNVGCDADAAVTSETMLELINASRSEALMCGANLREAADTLIWNGTLAEAARIHGVDMASNNFFAHEGSDGLGVDSRADRVAYNWRAIGENLAAGQLNMAEAHDSWLDSPGHCDNIMSQLYTEVGAACVSDSATDYGTYWVVVFGDPKQ